MTKLTANYFRNRKAICTIGLTFAAMLASSLSPFAGGRPEGNQNSSGPSFSLRMDVLNPVDGVNLEPFMRQTYKSIWHKCIETFPQDAELGEKGAVAVRFNVQKDGTLADTYPILESSSGKKVLDQHAVRVVRISAPFNSLPDGMTTSQLELRAKFYYNVVPPPH